MQQVRHESVQGSVSYPGNNSSKNIKEIMKTFVFLSPVLQEFPWPCIQVVGVNAYKYLRILCVESYFILHVVNLLHMRILNKV